MELKPFHKKKKASPNYKEGFLKELMAEKLSDLKLISDLHTIRTYRINSCHIVSA